MSCWGRVFGPARRVPQAPPSWAGEPEEMSSKTLRKLNTPLCQGLVPRSSTNTEAMPSIFYSQSWRKGWKSIYCIYILNMNFTTAYDNRGPFRKWTRVCQRHAAKQVSHEGHSKDSVILNFGLSLRQHEIFYTSVQLLWDLTRLLTSNF